MAFDKYSHLLDIVYFDNVRVLFDRTDPYLYVGTSYDTFELAFLWLWNSDSQHSIAQKLMERGKN